MLSNCGSGSKQINGDTDATYVVEGVSVKNIDRDTAETLVKFRKNGLTLATAEIIVDNDTLSYSGSYYYKKYAHAGNIAAGWHRLYIRDSQNYYDSINTIMPGDLGITQVVPDRREKRPNETVQVSWTGATNASGYIITAVKKNLIYTGSGYSQYVTSGATSASINDEAFEKPTLQGSEPDTGMYYLYVYAYSGSPDSVLSRTILPVPLPNNGAANISGNDITGRTGSVVVSIHDSVNVVYQ